MVVTSDPANVDYVLCKNFKNFGKGPHFKKIFEALGDGIFAAENKLWEIQRKTAMSMMKNTSFRKYVVRITWKKVDTCLIPILDHFSEMGIEVDLEELFQRFAFGSTCAVVLGHDPDSLSHDLSHSPLVKAFVDAEEAFLQRHILPETVWRLQKWLHIGKEKKFTVGVEAINHFLSKCISKKLSEFQGKDPTLRNEEVELDMLTSYLRATAENGEEKHQLSPEIWKDTMLNLLFAGKDTISSALTWFFWRLATHPAEEKKIREEIATYLQGNEAGSWILSNIEELERLTYLHGGAAPFPTGSVSAQSSSPAGYTSKCQTEYEDASVLLFNGENVFNMGQGQGILDLSHLSSFRHSMQGLEVV